MGFSVPGTYLVICNVRPHFQNGMMALVKSRRTTAFVLASLALAIAGVVLALQYFVVEHIPDLNDAKLASATKHFLVEIYIPGVHAAFRE